MTTMVAMTSSNISAGRPAISMAKVIKVTCTLYWPDCTTHPCKGSHPEHKEKSKLDSVKNWAHEHENELKVSSFGSEVRMIATSFA